MYTRVLHTQSDPANLANIKTLWAEHVPPILKRNKGFVTAYLLSNSTEGKGMSVTVWETKADADNYEKSGDYEAAVSPFRQYLIAPPINEVFDEDVRA
jgi:heme-degrading monooxygenase HmoA